MYVRVIPVAAREIESESQELKESIYEKETAFFESR